MKNKKGQVTIFIILAVVLISIAVVLVYVNQGGVSDIDKEYFSSASVKPGINIIQSSVIDCVEQTASDSLEVIGVQGGYYNEPADYFDLGWAFIPYYYNEGKFLMPPIKTIESELADYIDDNLNFCLDSLSFEDFDLSYKNSKSKVVIREKEVEFIIDMPIIIEREGKKMILDLDKFPISYSSSLNDMIEIADYITEGHREDPEMICISCVADMARERELFVDMLDFVDDTTTLIVVSNNETSVPFVFEFLNKYPV